MFIEIGGEERRVFQGGVEGFADLNGTVPGLLYVIGVRHGGLLSECS